MSFMKLRRSLAFLLGLSLSLPAAVAYADDDEDVDDEEVAAVDDEELADTDPSAVVVYRSALAPYGSWVETPGYGLVWVPNAKLVGSDFAPYVSSGHWELTEDGDWLWVSEYDWGYVPFHYGRWVWVSDVGWAWIPGRVYAPAWVMWRVGEGGYIGWAPYPATYYWVDGVAVHYHHHHHHAAYVFVHTDHCFDRHVHTHVIHDKAEVHKAAQATHQHAQPSHAKKGTHTPASPSLDDAHIKKDAAPKKLGKPDPRSLAFLKDDKLRSSKSAAAAVKPAAKPSPVSDRSYMSSALREKQKTFPARSKPAPLSREPALNTPSKSDDGRVVNARTQPPTPSGSTASRSKPTKSRASSSRNRPAPAPEFDAPSARPSVPRSSPNIEPRTSTPRSTPVESAPSVSKKSRPAPTPTKSKPKATPRRR